MTKSVSLIHYDIGNLLSVERALKQAGADLRIIKTPEEIAAAGKLILPGVGAFASCKNEIDQRGFTQAIQEAVQTGTPLLGICVGMQMLFNKSTEFGLHEGLGVIPGQVRAIPPKTTEGKVHKIPHIGWTPLHFQQKSALFRDVPDGAEVYFVHSFAAHPGEEKYRIADAFYGGHRLGAAVAKDNVFGVQFHPEKSGEVGLAILKNFLRI